MDPVEQWRYTSWRGSKRKKRKKDTALEYVASRSRDTAGRTTPGMRAA